MRFLIATHVVHKRNSANKIGGYAPYVREMNLWIENVDRYVVVAPIESSEFSDIDIPYSRQGSLTFISVPKIDFTTLHSTTRAFFLLPFIIFKIFVSFLKADHVHLRCPGNIGLLGCVVQLFLPFKNKTAKYAGNWGENSGQPWSYKLQKAILRNTFLTHNMQALVYGHWPGQSKNIVPFFTATYSESETNIEPVKKIEKLVRLIFVGTLTSNKNPLSSIQIAQALLKKGLEIQLELFGDGILRTQLESYIVEHHLGDHVFIRGNVSADVVKEAYKTAHFLVFLSNSEGWPKAVAEAMFWGCVPVVKPVSCVPWMLGNGERGVLVDKNNQAKIVNDVIALTQDQDCYARVSEKAMSWSRQFTLEKFEAEISKFL